MNVKRTAFAAVILQLLSLIFSTASYAQEGLIDRLTRLESGFANMKLELSELRRALDIVAPTGAVIAFNLESCPRGWTPYEQASGRFIVGVSNGSQSSQKPLGQTGGSETHRLSIAELPSHDHGGILGGDGKKAGMLNDWAYHAAGYVRIKPQGGGQPHNNMPPFLAQLYCIKN